MAKKKSAKKIKALLTPQKVLVNFKISRADMKVIQDNATKYAGGNYSAWLRYAGMNFTPTKKELTNVEQS